MILFQDMTQSLLAVDYGLVFGYQNTTQSSVSIQLCNAESFQKALWFHFLM